MTITKYTVVVDGKPITNLSQSLAISRDISDERLEQLKEAHIRRIKLEDRMELLDPAHEDFMKDIKEANNQWVDLQYELQELWGFEKTAKMHRNWWNLPHCTCPKLDNMDSYPYMQYTNPDCPLHGNN